MNISQIICGRCLHRIETSQFICTGNQLAVFFMVEMYAVMIHVIMYALKWADWLVRIVLYCTYCKKIYVETFSRVFAIPQKVLQMPLNPANINLFKVNKRNTRKRREIYLKLIIKTPERRHWSHSGVFIVNFKNISHLFLVFLILTLNK